MSAILAWILRNPLTSVLVCAILLLSGGTVVQTYRLNGARAEAAEASAALSTEQANGQLCTANVLTLEGKLDEQNKALKRAADEAARQAATKAGRAKEALKLPGTGELPAGPDAMNSWLGTLP